MGQVQIDSYQSSQSMTIHTWSTWTRLEMVSLVLYFWSSNKSIKDPPRNRFDLTNDNLSALFTVAESPQPSTLHFADNDEPTSFANEMMEKLDKFKIKKKLDFDDSSQATIPSVQDDRATCCTLKSFISEETISTDNIAPMVMTPSSKSGLSIFE